MKKTITISQYPVAGISIKDMAKVFEAAVKDGATGYDLGLMSNGILKFYREETDSEYVDRIVSTLTEEQLSAVELKYGK